MTWTKVGESRPRDPRLLRVPRSVRWLWLEATVWCNEHETDGEIPAHALRWITDEDDPAAAAQLLVDAGLWQTTPDGYRDVDFLDDQPSAEDVERTRVLARERQRKQRQHRNGDHSLCDPRYCRAASDSRSSHGVSHAVSHDTRTDPSVPTRTEGTEGRGGGAGPDSAGAPPAGSSGAGERLPLPAHPASRDCCPLPVKHPVHLAPDGYPLHPSLYDGACSLFVTVDGRDEVCGQLPDHPRHTAPEMADGRLLEQGAPA